MLISGRFGEERMPINRNKGERKVGGWVETDLIGFVFPSSSPNRNLSVAKSRATLRFSNTHKS
jgi:hypothetical protein